ncbi:MAG: response regulator [Planctomycetota bacterium]|nr:MAG: response regulator [Planctomycetota bacterium]
MVVLGHITIATFMGVSCAVSFHFLAIERLMGPVVRHLVDYGVVIDYDNLPTGRMQNRLLFLFALFIVVTAVMIATLANQKIADLATYPGRLDEVVSSLRTQTVLISACAVGMAVFLSTLLARSFTRRVGEMVDAMRRVEIGQLATRITAISTDEIGMLGRSFNKMVAQLEQNAKTIKALHENLERKVRERTKELTESKRRLQESYERLKENDRLKTEFFSNISHELRTPLTLILAPVENMREERLGALNAEQRRALDVVQRNTVRLLNLINDLLDFAKIDAGKVSLNPEPVDLNELVMDLVSSASLLAQDRGIALDFSPDETIPPAMLDRTKIEKVVVNLVSNALKFTSEGGRIGLETRYQNDQLTLIVSDTGIGIAPKDHALVFQRFVQVDGSLSRRYEGTGLGLPMVKEFVELHGGRVSLESELGQGACFTVTLPFVPARASTSTAREDNAADLRPRRHSAILVPEAPTAVTRNREAPRNAETILIVDDSTEMLGVLRTILGSEYHVLEASNGEDGWRLALEHEPDIIISDVMMPGLNGYEFCARIKGDERTARIGFIMLTAKADLAMKIEGLDQGADEYLVKPFNTRELQARVRSLIKVRRLDRQLQRRNQELERTLRELTRARDRLVHSEKMSSLGQLAAGIAHEINNSVNAVYNGILPLREQIEEVEKIIRDLMLFSDKEDPQSENGARQGEALEDSLALISELAEVIESGAIRTRDIVTDLKKFAHPGTGERKAFDVHEGIRMAINLLKNKLHGRIDVCCEFCEDGVIECSGSELAQVFLNLLDNARQAIEREGRIFVETRRVRDEMIIRVRDTGCGIPEHVRNRIFDPFFTTKEVGVGTGLGLAISYSIIHSHGGTIEVESPPSGFEEGTMFTIRLPVRATKEQGAEAGGVLSKDDRFVRSSKESDRQTVSTEG